MGGRGGPGTRLGAMLAVGALVWLAYAGAWVALEGPVLDEAGIAAPVITGDAGYPPGHPNVVVYRRALLASYQVAALEWAFHPDPWTVSASRNVVFLFLSAFVPFALVVAATHRPVWGHVAAALTLSETVCSAVGVYLMWVFPGVYSSGHFGIHLALLAPVLLAAGLGVVGGVLSGGVAAIHASMTLVGWPAALAVLGAAWVRGRPLGRALAGAAAGVVMAGLVIGGIAWRTAGDVALPPWDVRGDGTAILRTFIATTDPHRQPLPLPSVIGVFGPVAFAVLAWLALAPGGRTLPGGTARVAIVVTGAIAWGWALGARVLHDLLGELPLPLAMAMPARLANLGMLTIVPLATIAVARRAPGGSGGWIALALLAAEAGLLAWARSTAFVHLLFAIVGAALGAAWAGGETSLRRRAALAAAIVVSIVLASLRAADGSLVVPGFVAGLVVAGTIGAVVRRTLPAPVLAVACVAVAALAFRGPHFANVWDFGSERESAEERALGDWLEANTPRTAMILTPPFPPTWLQPKTGRPVLFDMITLLSMTYFPAEAEPVGRLVREVFDVDYGDPAAIAALLGPDGKLRPSSPAWLRRWTPRSCAAWHDLGQRWRFAFVLSPRTTPLVLPVAWTGRTWTLYRVPADAAACPAGGEVA